MRNKQQPICKKIKHWEKFASTATVTFIFTKKNNLVVVKLTLIANVENLWIENKKFDLI